MEVQSSMMTVPVQGCHFNSLCLIVCPCNNMEIISSAFLFSESMQRDLGGGRLCDIICGDSLFKYINIAVISGHELIGDQWFEVYLINIQ